LVVYLLLSNHCQFWECLTLTLPQLFRHSYLELSDWVVEDAVRAAIEDGEWERDVIDDTRRTNNIEIKVVNGQITAKGAGLQDKKSAAPKMMVCSDGMPAIATKTVRPQDVYDVSDNYCWV
jgi:hypothetical protein